MITVEECPLGSKCERTIGPCAEYPNGALIRCRWYRLFQGKNPQTGEDVNRWDCCIAMQAMLTIDNTRATYGVQAAVESGRNDTVKGLMGLAAVIDRQPLQIEGG